MFDLSGQQLGAYKLLKIIGKGGMSTVYQGLQESMNRPVAVKVLESMLVNDPEFSERFRREAETIANLQHPHILPVIDFGTQQDSVYLVMRLMTGGTLEREISEGPLSLLRTNAIITQVASALAYAHVKGIIHRDLKPANVLLDELGNAYLTDFGIAKMLSATTSGITSSGHLMGTPTYMAPEQWRSGPVDARTDGYALGIILYEMLVGLQPFEADTPYALMLDHLDKMPPSPVRYHPALPTALEPVIFKAISKQPDERYTSVLELAEALNQIVARAPHPDLRPVRPKKRFPPTRTGQRSAIEDPAGELEPSKQPVGAPHEAPKTPVLLRHQDQTRDDALTTIGLPRVSADPDASPPDAPAHTATRKPRRAAFASLSALLLVISLIAAAYLLVGQRDAATPAPAMTTTPTLPITLTATRMTASPQTPRATSAPDTCFASVTTAVNVRSGPGAGFAVSDRLVPGDLRPVLLRTTTGWMYVYSGWIDDRNATLSEACGALPRIAQRNASPGRLCQLRTTGEFADLRTDADPNAERAYFVDEGTLFAVYRVVTGADNQTWYYGVTHDAGWHFGWLAAEQAAEMSVCPPPTGPADTIPVILPTLTPYPTLAVTAAPPNCEIAGTANTTVNIRMGPGTNFRVSDRLEIGQTRPALLRTTTGWVYVYSGWIDDRFIRMTHSGCDTLPTLSAQDSSAARLCMIRAAQTQSELNAAPDNASLRLALIERGTVLTVFRVVAGADAQTWYFAATDDEAWRFGWIPAAQVEALTVCPAGE